MSRPFRFHFLAVFCAAALALPVAQAQTRAGIANPASAHCVAQGGRLVLEKDGSGGQFGVCLFEDNRQCEEWALLRGECPAGGIKVTGYATPAARYCAVRGARYEVLADAPGTPELGSCRFADGKACAAPAFFDGLCSPATAGTVIRAVFRCEGGRSIDALFSNGTRSSVSLALSDGRTLSLPQAQSASGARYAGADESFVFWNKGNTAFIDEGGRTTYAGCTTPR